MSADATSLRALVQAERERLLYAALPASLAANLLLAGILAWVQRGVIDDRTITAWLAAVVIVLALRAVLWFARRQAPPADGDQRWLWGFRFGTAMIGVVWGVGGWVLFPAENVIHQAFLSFMLAGICAGAVTVLSVDLLSAVGFSVPALVPHIVQFHLDAAPTAPAMGAMVVAFLVFIVGAARRMHMNLSESVMLRLQAQEREAALRTHASAIEATTVGVTMADASARDLPLIYVNPAFEHITGYTRREAIGRNCRFLQGADREQPGAEVIRAALQEGRAARALLRNYRKDGGLFWNEFSIAPVRDAKGRITHFVGITHDVTARVEAQAALSESEERFRKLADGAPALIWMSDIHNHGTWYNRRWLEYTGRQLEQERGFGWALGVHPDDLDRCMAYCNDAFEARRPFEMEFRLRRADGSYGWIADSGVPRFAADGTFEGYVGYCWDITDRKIAEGALRSSEAQLKEAQRTARLGSWVLDAATGALVWSDEIYAIFGRDPATFRPDLRTYYQDLVHPEDVAMVQREEQAAYRSGRTHSIDHRILRPDGELRWVHLEGVAEVDSAGIPVRLRGTLQDITARKRVEAALRASEERLGFLLQASPVVIYTCEPRGDFPATYVSANIERLFGYRPAQFVEDPGFWANNIHPEDAPRVFAELPRLFESDSHLHEYRFRMADGKYRWVQDELRLLRDARGEPLEIVGSWADITERKRTEQLKNEFVAVVSHELRTPLTAIRGALGLLAGGKTGALPLPLQELVGIAHKNSERLSHLVNDILDLERVSSGKLSFHLALHDLMALVAQALAANRPYAEQYDVRFEIGSRLDGVSVRVDADRLQQVFANLLSNAAKFSPAGESVQVDVMRQGGMARVVVTDRGSGIPEEFHARVFERFAQADASDSRQKGGSGLGLAISKEIVEQLGGSIGFESRVGNGASFFVDLPLIEPAAPR